MKKEYQKEIESLTGSKISVTVPRLTKDPLGMRKLFNKAKLCATVVAACLFTLVLIFCIYFLLENEQKPTIDEDYKGPLEIINSEYSTNILVDIGDKSKASLPVKAKTASTNSKQTQPHELEGTFIDPETPRRYFDFFQVGAES